MEILVYVVCTAGGFLFLAHKMIGWDGISTHKAKVDIAGSLLAYFVFAGTSTQGILIAVLTGFTLSVFTSIFGKLHKPKPKEKKPSLFAFLNQEEPVNDKDLDERIVDRAWELMQQVDQALDQTKH